MNGALIALLLFLAISIGALKDSKVKIKAIPYSILFPSLVFILIMVPIGVTYIGKEILSVKSNTMSIIGNADGWLSFFGGFFGGIIAVGGVYWQVTRKEKKEKEKKEGNVRRYIKFVLNKNSQADFFYMIHKELGLFDKNNLHLKPQNPLISFNQEYLNSNIDTILSLEGGDIFLEINEKILRCSKLFDTLLASKKNQIWDRIYYIISNIEKVNVIANIEKGNVTANIEKAKVIANITINISRLNNTIKIFSHMLYRYNNGLDNYPELKKTFEENMLNINQSLKININYKDVLNKLENKNPLVSQTALQLLIIIMLEMSKIIAELISELEESKIKDELEEIKVEIFELTNLFNKLSSESSEISKILNKF